MINTTKNEQEYHSNGSKLWYYYIQRHLHHKGVDARKLKHGNVYRIER